MTILSNIITPNNVLTNTNIQTVTNKTIDYNFNSLTNVQTTLQSGVNIKTINGTTVLGSGDITILSSTAIGLVRAIAINCILC